MIFNFEKEGRAAYSVRVSLLFFRITLMIALYYACVNIFLDALLLGYTKCVKYAAMIRGVGPENPNMRGEKLKMAFESVGLANVRPVITSGNVVFDSQMTDTMQLEKMIEEAFPRLLDFERAVFIRSQIELQALVDADPCPGVIQGPEHYITVTFLKDQPKSDPDLPCKPDGRAFEVLALYDRAVAATLDQTVEKTPNLMAWMERQYGRNITTRTWKTVNRLLAKLDEL
jgi:uncharacterized protein (DUF1697 family)